MHRTHLLLLVWAQAIYLIVASGKGISAVKMAEMLGVSYETAWHLGHRIRAMMAERNPLLSDIVEIDETYAGAPPRKRAEPEREDDDNEPPTSTSAGGSGVIALDFGLSTLFATSEGQLLGQGWFKCLWCGNRMHADLNAAANIKARRARPNGWLFQSKAAVLADLVRGFGERRVRALRSDRSGSRGAPADPRLTNPSFGGVKPVVVRSIGSRKVSKSPSTQARVAA